MKPILAAALHDVLPQKILTRTGKANFNMLNGGLANNRNALEQMIRQAAIDEEIIDRSVLIDCLEKAGMGVYKQAIAVRRLRLALSYLMWASSRQHWMERSIPSVKFQTLSGPQPVYGRLADA